MKKMFNTGKLSGYLYNHTLVEKESGPNSKNPGQLFISGNVEIATDDALTNIVTVTYRYVTPNNSKGPNRNYGELKNIIDGTYKSVMNDGADVATKISINSTAIALNDFYDQNGELVSVKRFEGGFIQSERALSADSRERNSFKVDMVITGVREVEGDADKGTEDKLMLKGYIFGYKSILPVEFAVLDKLSMEFFSSLEVSSKHPIAYAVTGKQIHQTIVRRIVEEGAYGPDIVHEVTSSRKEFIVDWAAKEPYEFGAEEFITVDEMKELIASRELYLANRKAQDEEYRAKRNGGTVAPKATAEIKSFNDLDFSF